MTTALAHAKLNLALVVGPRRADGLHEVATVLQRIDLADTITLEPAERGVTVDGFPEDTLVRRALELAGGSWSAGIEKRIPVAAGLGGGSSDAAAVLRLARPDEDMHDLAAQLGADVPFFLTPGPKLARGSGTDLTPVELPQDYAVVLVLPHGETKSSTADVYAAFDGRGGAQGFESRRDAVLAALEVGDLAALPRNDLATSPFADELVAAGAFRADVSGAGPAVYGLFADAAQAEQAAAEFEARGAVWVTKPAW